MPYHFSTATLTKMETRQFVMDTKGYCLLCLKLSSSGEDGNNQEGDPEQVFSLRRVCHYLRLNLRRIFSDLVATTPASTSLSVLEKSELKGVLCEECSQMNETFSEITLELEVLQMTLDSIVRQMRDKVEGVGKNRELMEAFKTEMLSRPQTLLHYGIVEQFRKETLKKCSKMIRTAQPRVLLERCVINEVWKVAGAESPSPPSPSVHDSPEAEGNLECKFCQKSFRHKWLRVDHEKTFHREQFQCDLCPKTFMFRVGLVTHRKRSHGGGSRGKNIFPPVSMRYPVPTAGVPDSVFKPSTSNAEPPQLQSNDKKVKQKFHCQFCTESFSLRTSLLMHRYQEHKRVNTSPTPSVANNQDTSTCEPEVGTRPDPPFKCEFCPVQFSHERSLYRHMTNFHNYQGTRKQLATAIREVRSQLLSNTDNNKSHLRAGGGGIEGIEETSEETPNQLLEPLPEADGEQELKPTQSNPEGQMAPDNKYHKCRYCHKEYEKLGSLRHHVTVTHHLSHSIKRYECETCRKRFTRKDGLVEHRKTIHQGKRYPCEYCSALFTQSGSMRFHMRNVCPKRANYKGKVQTEVQKSVSYVIPNKKAETGPDFQCPVCPASYKTKPSLNMHQYRKHGRLHHQPLSSKPEAGSSSNPAKPEFHCDYCPMKFWHSSNKSRHMRNSHNYISTRRRNAAQPSTSHGNLSLKIGAIERVEINEGEEKIPNFLPEDRDQESSSFQVQTIPEMESEPGSDNRYKCQHCPKRFKYPKGLRQHQTKAHFRRAAERRFKCKTCGKKFLRGDHLRIHHESIHKGIKHLCQYCSSEFTQLGAMRNHMKKLCPKRFDNVEGSE